MNLQKRFLRQIFRKRFVFQNVYKPTSDALKGLGINAVKRLIVSFLKTFDGLQ